MKSFYPKIGTGKRDDLHNLKNYEEVSSSSEKVVVPNWNEKGFGRSVFIEKSEPSYDFRTGNHEYKTIKIKCFIVGYIVSKSKPKEYILLKQKDSESYNSTSNDIWKEANNIRLPGKHFLISKKRFLNICENNKVTSIIHCVSDKVEFCDFKKDCLTIKIFELYD